MNKTLIAALSIFLGASPVFAATCYELRDPANNASLAGTIDCATDEIDMEGGFLENGSPTLSNSVTGNAGTATALAANGANCSANQFNKGVDASGAAESCAALVEADITNGIVTSSKLGADAVIESKIFNGVVTTPKLADDSVTKDKIAADSCTDGQILKLSGSVWVCGTDNDAGGTIVDSTNTWTAPNTYTSTITVSFFRMTCPSAFTEVHRLGRTLGCMQTAEQGSANWHDANDDCFDTFGGRLPFVTEFHIACVNFTLTDETNNIEHLADFGSTNDNIAANSSCTATLLVNDTDVRAYRCWISK